MCGITGVAAADAAALRAIGRMTDAVRHRGPDDEGYVLLDSASGQAWPRRGEDTVPAFSDLPRIDELPQGADIALGHRRLAILDVSHRGHGPMASRDGRLWVSFNGEIYNYLELRAELEPRGHRFETGCDTEVLLAAWAEWGEDALDRCNGMFAFALFDARRSRLYCVRDRFGVKPLYYHWNGSRLVFASEIKGVAAHPDVPVRPDERRLLGFLARGALDEAEHTFFEGILSLRAGHLLTLDPGAGQPGVRPWYRLPEAPERAGSAVLGSLLEDSVRIRLRSDVAVGTCLSGGLDSSAIVALTAKLREGSDKARRSFSIVYRDRGLDEGRYIDEVVELTGVASALTTATAASLQRDLPALARAQDEPVPSPGPYSHWRVMELARDAGVKVLLDGQGADEILAGYHYHFGPYLAEIALRSPPKLFRAASDLHRVTGVPIGLLAGLFGYHLLPLPVWLRRSVVGRFSTHSHLPRSALDPKLLREHDPLPGGRHQPRRRLCAELRANVTSTSLPALLRYEDRNSMAFGIEARTPFLDYRLVEAALALPSAALIRDGWTKAPLRESMSGLIPESVRLRRDKLGFPTPERRWLVELAGVVRDWLGPGSYVAVRLRPQVLERWRNGSDEDLGGRRGLWRLVAAEHWLRHAASLSAS